MSCGDEITEPTVEDRIPLQFCQDCLYELPIYSPPFCLRCGAGPVPQPIVGCGACRKSRFRFAQTIALGKYDAGLRHLLLKMKHETGEATSLAVAQLMWSRCRERLTELTVDVVVPVPMYWLRRLERGTNSPHLLAESLARRLHRPLAGGLMYRRRKTLPQSSLAASERDRNLRDALAVRAGYALSGAKVLLVDDIMTTGATANEASRVLKRAGASEVTLAVVARSGAD